MARESEAQSPHEERISDSAAQTSGSGARPEAARALRLPSSPARSLSFGSVVAAAVASGVLAGVALSIGEQVAGGFFFSLDMRWELWPWDVVIAATGRIIVTHLLFWIPVMAACGVLYWPIARRRGGAAPEPFFLALFTLLATVVVFPADLEIAERRNPVFLTVGLIAGLGVSLSVYFLARGLHNRLGRPRFQRWFRLATAAAVMVALVAGFCFARSPLLNPGAYRVAPAGATPASRKHTNVLWVVLDAARADRFSVYGHDAPTTPFLDEWAQQSIVFDRAIADGIWTLPSHASMFTGLPACSHGCGHKTDFLADSFQTVAETLRENGYATACFSNNPFVGPHTNLSQGFDTPLVLYHFQRATRFSLAFLCEQLGLTPPLPWLDYDYGAALANCLIARWLDRHGGAPVFLFVNYMETHLPYRTPKRYRRMFMSGDDVRRSYQLRRRAYGTLEKWLGFDANVDGYENMPAGDRAVVRHQYESALRYLDDRVRELIEVFRDRGLLDDTLVVIAADHGEYLDTHGLWSHYFLTYQDVIHVPLLLRPPGLAGARREPRCVQLSDLFPTLLHATLGPDAAAATGQARDLLNLPPDDENRIVISECFGPEPSVGPRLLVKTDPAVRHRAASQIAAVDARYKYIRSGDGMRELYDLHADPGELDNLAYSHWKDTERLERYIDWWLKAVPEYQPEPTRDGAGRPGRDTMKLLEALGYVGGDDD